ncbi:MAG: methionine gamma-lyase family protein [Firmicutes bacterium]|nr:methionine gamma-lyase family protein [Bacillota bacterium]
MNIDIKSAENKLINVFNNIDDVCFYNSQKVIKAFWQANISETDFNSTTGYGYGDVGRDKIEKVYSDIFETEAALVRNQFISGTHALSTAFFALLRPGDLLLSITGKPYDTLDSIIGFNDNQSSLKSFGIRYDQIDLKNNCFDYEAISKYLKLNKVKVIEIQRSIGYSTRSSIGIEDIDEVIRLVKGIDKDIIVMVDNCYCEFVGKLEPTQVGADICVGSLIKNLGGGIASNGAYIVGKKDLINLCSERLNVAGEASDVGPSLGANKMFLQGLYMAPSVVANALKTSVLAAYLLEKMGYSVNPRWNDERNDIVLAIKFNDKEKLIKFVEGIQSGSAIDANVLPVASSMPGYDDEIIMASGSFTQGSSIEISCDGPLRKPYIAYLQGGLTYEYGKIALIKALEKIM